MMSGPARFSKRKTLYCAGPARIRQELDYLSEDRPSVESIGIFEHFKACSAQRIVNHDEVPKRSLVLPPRYLTPLVRHLLAVQGGFAGIKPRKYSCPGDSVIEPEGQRRRIGARECGVQEETGLFLTVLPEER